MSDRMEKTREALATSRGLAAAFAEVEEWETRLSEVDRSVVDAALAWKARAEAAEAAQSRTEAVAARWEGKWQAAEAEVAVLKESLAQYDRGWKAAEAERDRLREALDQIESTPEDPLTVQGIARAALGEQT